MKKDIHPDARYVIFEDSGNSEQYLIMSSIKTEETGKYKGDGKEYPLYKVEISSSSHPFYTGNEKVLDTAGRVERFKKLQKQAESAKK
ncbi:type B 50S ribosomal protein L31 [Candidatus Nomurabacteria bacterium]|nr:type B 50S ribosomal protein L31 [Candidatus Nomurabacteria bacterium]USN94988.1 MAG: type B 50S ribosomal protein L31 [Candidatus Nomurabacteria bacterium]